MEFLSTSPILRDRLMKPISEQTVPSSNSTVLPYPPEVEILQIKIELKKSKPPIWRRIQIPNSYTFGQLHLAVNKAMGWSNIHLHTFIVKDKNNPILEITSPIKLLYELQPRFTANVKSLDENKTPVIMYLKKPKDQIFYNYDFEDQWTHKITLEKTYFVSQDKLNILPKCINGRRACPPEDYGGIEAYNFLLTFLKHPYTSESQCKDFLKQVGPDFDPNKFDPNKVFENGFNAELLTDCPF